MGTHQFEAFSADHDGKQAPIEFETYEMPKDPEVSPMRTRLLFDPAKSKIVFANILEYTPKES